MMLPYPLDLRFIFFLLLGGTGEITAEKSHRKVWAFEVRNVISDISPAAGWRNRSGATG